MRTLSELEVEKDKIVYALNKSDLIKKDEIKRKINLLNLSENEKVISVSAKTGENIKELKKLIKDITDSQNSHKFDKNSLKEVKTFDN